MTTKFEKRILAIILIVSMVITTCSYGAYAIENPPEEGTATEETVDNGMFQYLLRSDGTAEILKYTGNESHVYITNNIGYNGVYYNITKIHPDVFGNEQNPNNIVENIQLDFEGVESVDVSFLKPCVNLRNIHVSYGIPMVNYKNIPWYENQPEHQNIIVDGWLYGCKGSRPPESDLSIAPDEQWQISGIAAEAFKGETDLIGIGDLPNLNAIEDGAFDGCSLGDITLKNADINIKGNPFRNNPNLVIHGIPGGSVEAFANEHGYPFVDRRELITLNDFEFSLCDDRVELLKYTGTDANVTIPKWVETDTGVWYVDSININSFGDENNPNNIVESITFEDGSCYNLDFIKYCNSLRSINAGENVDFNTYPDIKNSPFFNYQPDGAVTAGSCLIGYKGNAPAVLNLPSGIKTICDNAFSGNQEIKEVILPDTVRYIRYRAFADSSLTSITIPAIYNDGPESGWISYDAFSGVKTPFTIMSYKNTAAEDYVNSHKGEDINFVPLDKKVTIGDFEVSLSTSVAVLERYTGDGTEVVIPHFVNHEGKYYKVEIGNEAFSTPDTKNNTLQKVIFKFEQREDVYKRYIDFTPFNGCTALSDVVLEPGCEISNYNTSSWYKNQSDGLLYLGDTLYEYKGTAPANTKITIKNGTKYIGINAFYNQAGIVAIELPESIESFDTDCLHNSGVKSISVPKNCSVWGNAEELDPEFVINGYYDSPAYRFANEHSIGFKHIGPEATVDNCNYWLGEWQAFLVKYVGTGNEAVVYGSLDTDGYRSVEVEHYAFDTPSKDKVTTLRLKNISRPYDLHYIHCLPNLTNIIVEDDFWYVDDNFYVNYKDSPWYANQTGSVVIGDVLLEQKGTIPEGKVIIDDNIKAIGANAFAGRDDLTEITIPASVMYISETAFSGCNPEVKCYSGSAAWKYAKEHGLKVTDISEKRTVGNFTYSLNPYTKIATIINYTPCENLYIPGVVMIEGIVYGVEFDGILGETEKDTVTKSVTIGEGLLVDFPYNPYAKLDFNMFNNMENLNNVKVDKAYHGFKEKLVRIFNVLKAPWFNNQKDGEIYLDDTFVGVKGEVQPGTKINVKEGTKVIGQAAMSGEKNLTAITLPDSLELIEYKALSECGLKSLTVPSLVYIEYGALLGNDPEFVINGHLRTPAHFYASENNIKFKSIDKEVEIGGITYSLNDETGRASITAYDGVTENITLSNVMTIDGKQYFLDLAHINLDVFLENGENNTIKSINFENKSERSVYGHDSSYLYYFNNLVNVEFSGEWKQIIFGDVKSSSWYANQVDGPVYFGDIFVGYKGPKPLDGKVVLKEGTQTINYDAFGPFEERTWVKELVLPSTLERLDIGEISNTKITSITIPEMTEVSEEPIEKVPFTEVKGYRNSDAERYAIANNIKFVEIGVSEVLLINDFKFKFDEGNYFHEPYFRMIEYVGKGKNIVIPSTITYKGKDYPTWGHNGFFIDESGTESSKNDSIVSIKLEDGSIPPENFHNYTHFNLEKLKNLKEIYLPEGAGRDVTWKNNVENTPWYNNQKDGLVTMGKFLYGYKGNITPSDNIVIGSDITDIGACAFDGETKLSNVTIPNTVTGIQYGAFANCNLTSVYVPESVEFIDEFALGYLSDGKKAQKIKDFTIFGKAGSVAEEYATINGFSFADPDKAIEAKNITFDSGIFKKTAEGYECEYTGKTIPVKPVVKDNAGKTLVLDEDYTVSVAEGTVNNAGTYNISIKGIGSCAGVVNVKLIVKAATMNITATGYEGAYDGNPHSIKLEGPEGTTYKYAVNDEGVYRDTNPLFTDAGTYTVNYSASNPNYEDVRGTATVVIKPADIGTKATLSQDSFVYTGNECKPKVIIDGLTDEDFNVTYTNNIDAGTAKATVTGKGNYSGKIIVEFAITPADMLVEATGYSGTYDGKAHSIKVTAPKGATISYAKDNGAFGKNNPDFTDAGTYTVKYRVEKANYNTVENAVAVNISPVDIKDKVATLDKDTFTYNGKENKPVITVDGLKAGTDFTVTYTDNTNAGTAKVTVTGIKNYRGTISKDFTINKADISEKILTLSAGEIPYTGKEIMPEVKINGLTKGKDFDVTYKNNIKVGKADVIVTGKGNYEGTVNAKFTIVKADMTVTAEDVNATYDGNKYSILVKAPEGATIKYATGTNEVFADENPAFTLPGKYTVKYIVEKQCYNTVEGSAIVNIDKADISGRAATLEFDNKVYTGKEIKPGVKVNGLSDSDFTVEYANNVKAGTAKVIIKGTGNYKGQITKTFQILKGDMAVTGKGSEQAYDGKAYSVTVTAPEGAVVTYATSKNGAYASEKPSFINAGTYEVFYRVEKENFNTVNGTLTVKITHADITAKVMTLEKDTFIYSGSEITPVVSVDGLKAGTDYKVTYTDNVNAGTAKATVTGTGNYAGTMSKTFSITKADMSDKTATPKYEIVDYTGSAMKPEILIKGLKFKVDFTVEYKNNIEAGIATAIVKGIGNFKGQLTVTFTIKEEKLEDVEKVTKENIDKDKNIVINSKTEDNAIRIKEEALKYISTTVTNGLNINFTDDSEVKYDKKAVNKIKEVIDEKSKSMEIKLKKVDKKDAGNETQKEVVEKNNAMGVFSITLNIVNEDGSITEIHDFEGGKAKVTVPFENPMGLELQVYRVEDDGTMVPMKTFYVGGKLTWETDGHSYYMVAEKPEEPVAPENPEVTPVKPSDNNSDGTTPKTGDDMNLMMWVIMLAASALTVTVVRKKHNK